MGIFIGGCLPYVVYLKGLESIPWFLIVSVFVLLFYRLVSHRDTHTALAFAAIEIFGLLYISLLLSYLLPLIYMKEGRLWLFFLFVVIWSNDALAYYVGKNFGSHKLAPNISPNKSIEGSIGGIAGSVTAAVLLEFIMLDNNGIFKITILSLCIAVIGQIGDLFESMIKRSAGVKDSGFIIPGHGGILDRIDSLVFTLPFLFYFLKWSGG